MQAFVCKQITGTGEINEYRMSNKEFRMTKFNSFDLLLRRSAFLVRPARYALKQIRDRWAVLKSVTATVAVQSTSQGRRVFCGSIRVKNRVQLFRTL